MGWMLELVGDLSGIQFCGMIRLHRISKGWKRCPPLHGALRSAIEMEGDGSSGLTIQGGDHDHSVRHGPFLLHLKALFRAHFV